MKDDLERRLAAVESRNQRVEGDKAWEMSLTRRVLIAALTYVVVAVYNWAIGGNAPLLTAFVPVGGYLLSTLTVPIVKRRWLFRHITVLGSKS